ncbi:MAG: folate-binding protein YgfZ [Gammaproteobacteria bacterium]|nr:folate-binding protein YgfZ [Gammaproteobacteria bacterium]
MRQIKPNSQQPEFEAHVMTSKPIPESAVSVLAISGADAASLLQGQLTNDVMHLERCWQHTGLCNPKGRLFSALRLWRHEGTFYALLPAELANVIAQRLQMFVLRSKVEIAVLHTPPATFYPDLRSLQSLQHIEFNNLQANAVVIDDERHLMFDDDVCLELDLSDAASASQQLDGWLEHHIERGQPWLSAALSEQFVPQMVNLDLVEGINFKKGCYTGQEIVARMHYLGKLKQRMFVCDWQDSTAVASAYCASELIGHRIVSTESGDATVGTIVCVAPQSSRALAVLRIANKDENLRLKDGPKLQIAETQPYDVTV